MASFRSQLRRAFKPLIRRRVRELRRGSKERGERGISSLLAGIVVGLMLFFSFAVIVIWHQLQLGQVPEDVERQRMIQEKLRERLEGEVLSVQGENVTLGVRNIGDIAVSIEGVERRVGDRLETSPLSLELAPNEEREFTISMGVFEGLGLLTSRGNLFPMGGEGGGLEILVLDSETLEPVPDASITGTIRSDPIEVDVRTNERGLVVLRPPFYRYDEHELDLVVSALGYDDRFVVERFTLAENGQIIVHIDYDPFDLTLSETSGSMTRYTGESWGPRQTTVTATPRNAYETLDAPYHVGLATEADEILATVGSDELKFTSPASTTLMMRPPTSISSGTSTVTVKAYDFNGRLVETAWYDLSLATQSRPSVPQPSPDFTISVSPSSRTINPGADTSYTVTLTSVNGYSGEISLSVSGLPRDSTGGVSPDSVSLTSGGSATSTLSVDTATSTPVGTYTLTVQGRGSRTKSASASLTIEAAPPPRIPEPMEFEPLGGAVITYDRGGPVPYGGYMVWLGGVHHHDIETDQVVQVAESPWDWDGLIAEPSIKPFEQEPLKIPPPVQEAEPTPPPSPSVLSSLASLVRSIVSALLPFKLF